MQLASLLRNDSTFLEAKQTAPYSYIIIVCSSWLRTWMPFDFVTCVGLKSRTDQKFSDAQFVGGGGADLTPPPPPPPPLDEILYVIGVAIKISTIFSRLKSHFDFQLPGCLIQIVFRSSTLLLFKLSDVCYFHLLPIGRA